VTSSDFFMPEVFTWLHLELARFSTEIEKNTVGLNRHQPFKNSSLCPHILPNHINSFAFPSSSRLTLHDRSLYHDTVAAAAGAFSSGGAAGRLFAMDLEKHMAIRRILHYPEPLLKQVSAPVAAIDETLKTLAADMAETMYAAPGVGLAAPQVGVLQRLVVLDCGPKDEPHQLIVAINPEIVAREGDVCEEEGCLSVPAYYARVQRSAQVTVRFLDLDGNTRQLQADGLWAIAFQHEIDHLDGILFVDHLSPLKRSLFRKKYKKLMEQQEEQL